MNGTRRQLANSTAVAYFSRIKQIWHPFQNIAAQKGKFIIPFCTPLRMQPPALVIGTNHSDFDPRDPDEATNIARSYATKPAETNTYMEHRHNFAKQLRRMCKKANLPEPVDWVEPTEAVQLQQRILQWRGRQQ
jgi:hypothetical protein